MWILLEIILALLGRKFGRADEQEDLEDVKNSEEYMVMTPLQQWKARRRSKVKVTGEEIAYCSFAFIHLVTLVYWLSQSVKLSEGGYAFFIYVFALPLLSAFVAAVVVAIYQSVKNWQNQKLRILLFLSAFLIMIYIMFDPLPSKLSEILAITFSTLMIVMPSW